MLVQFSFSNFKCFKDETILNLTTTKIKSKHFYSYATPYNYRVLKALAVYGANASGKSKLFEAFNFLKRVLMAGKDEDGNLSWMKYYDGFRLNTSAQNKSSMFETVFILNNIQYRYSLELDCNKIISESLFRKGVREVYVFERTIDGIRYNKTYVKKAKMLIDEGMVKDDIPFLTMLNEWKDALSSEIINWFKSINVISSNELISPLPKLILNEKIKNVILSFLNKYDINIEDIAMHEIPVGDILDKIKMIIGGDNLKGKFYDGVSTAHKVYDDNHREMDKMVSFQMEKDESFGSNRLLHLCFPLLSALSTSSVIFIDEFDCGIHPNILRDLISMFYTLNDSKAQLIINTQNSSLLNRDFDMEYQTENEDFYHMKDKDRKIFINDQIYFVAKNRYGESSLVPLTDFKGVRSNVEDLYLSGLLEGVPNIDNNLVTIN